MNDNYIIGSRNHAIYVCVYMYDKKILIQYLERIHKNIWKQSQA